MIPTIVFGDWLKQRRKALDLTQEQLGDRVGCSDQTIRKIEAGTRRPSREMVEAIAQRLAVPPEERAALVELARLGSGVAHTGLPASLPGHLYPHGPSAGLPRPLTTFVGRHKQIEAVRSLLGQEDVRLLTLTGAGGSGKTRLAVRVAADLQQDFPDGVFFVSLAPITDPNLVASTIARTLGVQEVPGQTIADSVKHYLAGKRLLLLLDNFEQVVAAAPLVAELLSDAANLTVLVTSREPLHLYGERRFAVPPLQLPDRADKRSLEDLRGYEAVDLFVQRAMLMKSDFGLTEENAAAVSEICKRLDGLPLAIELAAARTNVLAPQAMLSQMENRLSFLTGGPKDIPGRQQTLRNTIEWSYNLLSEDEKALFRRLAVFAGGSTFDAIRVVCNGNAGGTLGTDVLDLVAALVDKSLLRQEDGAGGEPRFWMLETIREYAAEKLEDVEEAPAMKKEHALYFVDLAEKAEPNLSGSDQQEWFDRLEDDYDNMRQALVWARQRSEADASEGRDAAERIEMGLRTAGAIWKFWQLRGYFTEGRLELQALISRAAHADCSMESKAKALHALGSLAWRQGDYSAARAAHEQAISIHKLMGDERSMAESLIYLGAVAAVLGDYGAAHALLEQSLSIHRELGDKLGVTHSLSNLGLVSYLEHDYATARPFIEETLAIQRELGDKRGIAMSLNNLANISYIQGDYLAARSLHKQSLSLKRELVDKAGIAVSLAGLGEVAAETNNLYAGAVLLGACDALFEDIGAVMDPDDRILYERGSALVQARLEKGAFSKAQREGHSMSMEEAIAYALQES